MSGYSFSSPAIRDAAQRSVFSEPARISSGQPLWSEWSVSAAVKEGLKSNSWVYRCINLNSKSAAMVPLVVVDANDEAVYDHPVSQRLASPNSQFSRNQTFELLYAWMELSGLAYLYVGEGGYLWPMSPDRIAPIADDSYDIIVKGYAKVDEKGKRGKGIAYEKDKIIALRALNPANPLEGISPLQAVGKTVDVDNAQAAWNASLMQSKGIMEAYISVEGELTEDQQAALQKRINEKYNNPNNKNRIGILGGNSKYHPISTTPQEAAFDQSRKSNRDEILAAFGVPPALLGVSEVASYNNLATSSRLHWEAKVIPLVDGVADAISHHYHTSGELPEDMAVRPDYSEIAALRSDMEIRMTTAQRMFEMGVPVEQINSILGLRVEAYDSWDEPNVFFMAKAATQASTQPESRDRNEPTETRQTSNLKPLELRQLEGEFAKAEAIAEQEAEDAYAPFLADQRDAVFKDAALPIEVQANLIRVIEDTNETLTELMLDQYLRNGVVFGRDVVVEQRAEDDEALIEALKDTLDDEGIILREVSLIQSSTVRALLVQIEEALANGYSINELQQAVDDAGIFDPERALRISRTVTGSVQSVGQMISAAEAGATHKTWIASKFHTRDKHVKRNGERVLMGAKFRGVASENGAYPRWPLDPELAAADRVNCRCAMTFDIE